MQDGAAALLFCYLLAHPEPLDFGQAEFTLGADEKELKRAFCLLRDAGLLLPLPAPSIPAVDNGQLTIDNGQFAQDFGQSEYELPDVTDAPAVYDVPLVPEAPELPDAPEPEIQPEPRAAAVVERPRGLDPGERPNYDSGQITDALRANASFKDVVREAESRLNKVLSPSDLQTLYGIYDWRGLPPGVISLLINHCVEEARERYGPGRPPTLKQIDKEAASWEREGVDTETRAEAHLADLAERRELRSEILATLQIRNRLPTATEERYIKDWIQSGHSIDLIMLAYDKTIIRTGNLSWKYMDTILKSWKEKRLTTAAEVEESDAPRERAPTTKPRAAERFSGRQPAAGQMERAAVDDMRDFLRRLREDQE